MAGNGPVLRFKNIAGQVVRMRASDLTGCFSFCKDGVRVWDVHCRLFGPVAVVDEATGNRIVNYILDGIVGANEARHAG